MSGAITLTRLAIVLTSLAVTVAGDVTTGNDVVLAEQAQKLNYLEALVLQQSGKLSSVTNDLEQLRAGLAATPSTTQGARLTSPIAFEAQYRHDPMHNVFDNEIMMFDNIPVNLGGGYDVNNSTFVAPVNGVYVLEMKVTPSPNGHVYVYLMVNDQKVDSADANDNVDQETGYSTKITQLQRGDRVWMVKDNGVTSVRGWAHTRFSGFLLSART